MTFATSASAAVIETNIPDLSLRWDNTITETELFRTENAPNVNLNSPNSDDTDRNIPHGLAAARTDLYSEVDLKYKEFGIRGSAAAWADAVYLHNNANNSPSTLNSDVANNQTWQRQSAQLAGYHAEVADLFTYGAFAPASGQQITYRVGQFAQLWGESLYLATNGISYAMNPIDGIKGQLLLNPEARDVYMPTPQISMTYSPVPAVTISAYYKLGFRQTRAAPVGTYFSSTDTLDYGGNKIYTQLPSPLNAQAFLQRTQDIRPNGADGQFGVSFKYNFGDYDIGLYALRYDETTPQIVYPHPNSQASIGAGLTNYIQSHYGTGSLAKLESDYFATNSIGSYQVAYPRGIQMYGASYSGNIFQVFNVGAEASIRHNTDLVSVVQAAGPNASNGNNPAYAIGDTAHGQVSVIYASPPVHLIRADQVQVTGEIGFNELLDVTQNKQALAPGVSHFASLGDVVVSASYYSVAPGIDLTPSIGMSGQLVNSSAVDGSERAHTGTITLGLASVVRQKYNFLVQYRHYIGANSATNPLVNNLLLGRDFVGLTFSVVL